MPKRVTLLTGTPCVGKTSAARLLTVKLNALYVNLTELAVLDKLVSGKDETRNTIIIDEPRMKKKIRSIIQKTDKKQIVIDGHYAVNVVPKELVTRVFVLRRDPVELRGLMEHCGFQGPKLFENLASEALDVCLFDALKAVAKRRVCELNVTGQSVEETVEQILFLLRHPSKCRVGVVDWLGKLENEGLLDEYVKLS
ncbi:MAG: AAA family ATPase [Candidatus Bathyarchaeia archaeon]|jgi:broad-specificity NMP kinase